MLFKVHILRAGCPDSPSSAGSVGRCVSPRFTNSCLTSYPNLSVHRQLPESGGATRHRGSPGQLHLYRVRPDRASLRRGLGGRPALGVGRPPAHVPPHGVQVSWGGRERAGETERTGETEREGSPAVSGSGRASGTMFCRRARMYEEK